MNCLLYLVYAGLITTIAYKYVQGITYLFDVPVVLYLLEVQISGGGLPYRAEPE